MGVGNIWQWEGRVDRGRYAAVGVVAFALKFLLEWLVVIRLFHRPWSLLNYWRPFGAISGVHGLSLENRLFAGVMLFLALPFIWLGLAMTVKRLRDAGEPSWLAALFFAPVANLLFFLALSFKPTAVSVSKEEGAPWPGPAVLDAWIPETRVGSAIVSIAITAAIGLGLTLLGTQAVATYGWGLFVGLPIPVVGSLAAAVIFGGLGALVGAFANFFLSSGEATGIRVVASSSSSTPGDTWEARSRPTRMRATLPW
jgi:uncharacterized membrane protein YhaH (DUF805 family)